MKKEKQDDELVKLVLELLSAIKNGFSYDEKEELFAKAGRILKKRLNP